MLIIGAPGSKADTPHPRVPLRDGQRGPAGRSHPGSPCPAPTRLCGVVPWTTQRPGRVGSGPRGLLAPQRVQKSGLAGPCKIALASLLAAPPWSPRMKVKALEQLVAPMFSRSRAWPIPLPLRPAFEFLSQCGTTTHATVLSMLGLWGLRAGWGPSRAPAPAPALRGPVHPGRKGGGVPAPAACPPLPAGFPAPREVLSGP